MAWKSMLSTLPILQVQNIKSMEIFIILFYLNNRPYFFLIISGDSTSFFNDPIEFPHSIFSDPLEIPRPQPPCLDF